MCGYRTDDRKGGGVDDGYRAVIRAGMVCPLSVRISSIFFIACNLFDICYTFGMGYLLVSHLTYEFSQG